MKRVVRMGTILEEPRSASDGIGTCESKFPREVEWSTDDRAISIFICQTENVCSWIYLPGRHVSVSTAHDGR